MAKHQFRKYIWIIDRLFRTGGITYKELAEAWENSSLNDDGRPLPKRTFDDYKRAIEETFDLNIICNASSGYTYRIENTDDISKDHIKSWLLSSFAVNNIIQESRKLKARILFERIPSGNELLMTIIEAMQTDRRLQMTYQSFHCERPRTFLADPYCVKVSRQRWYVVVFEPECRKIRTYALDRMKRIEPTDESFVFPDTFDAETYFADAFGVIVVPEELDVETIRLKVSEAGNKRKYFRSLPLHPSQNEVERYTDYSVFEYRLYPTYDFFQEVLSHGAEVELLSPEWVRGELRYMVEEMHALYREG
ncbi:helix-turn-helix transcriptional regulator [Tannerella forsythia]|uniref:helix-turn-helix transcriptional regulator n=1 Tax=Tannerella forsythia TaxID=28112 RepID=UPI00062B0D08|nr:WYL domain-containing protein [Tannerella forsythia]KKY60746.1 hypothetical protein Tanf_11035 [Tannerella forsythia]TPE17390.1 WYL domain-containing protein [Tannerella forsythia]